MQHPSKAATLASAQASANRDGKPVGVFNLNPYGSQWVVRDLRSYDPRSDLNQPDKLYVRPATKGLYILYKNGKRAMNIAGKVPVYRDGDDGLKDVLAATSLYRN